MAAKSKGKKPKGKESIKKAEVGKSRNDILLDECQAHEEASYKSLETIRDGWDAKEAIHLVKVEDKLSKETPNRIFDPILPEMSLERTARVMAQNPTGKAWAVSKNDVGKNILMNHLHKHWRGNANAKWSHLIKLRMLDYYSSVYGSMFGVVPWWVDLNNGYIGPELFPVPMRNARPQPGKVSPDESDRFGVKDRVSIQWLLEQDAEVWNMDEILALMRELRDDEDEGDYPITDVHDAQSYVENELYPTKPGDKAFPQIDIFTEFRDELWLTWAPRRENKDKSRAYLLRVVENGYPEGMLPIVKKDAFPLIDSMIGLGDFEKGMSLQLAVNSLWNLYLVGEKQRIFPPLHIDPNSVVPSSIKWGLNAGAGERWFMNRPNVDVQTMKFGNEGQNSFQSTYGYLQSGIFNLFGSTQVSQPQGAAGDLGGKSPEAIKRRAFKESSRDEWDRFMMEETIKSIYKRWTALGVENLDIPTTVRIFGAEIKDLQAAFPDEDILEVFDSKKRGNVTITKDKFLDIDEDGNVSPVQFDFELDAGSTLKKNPEEEAEFLQALLDTLLAKPELVKAIEAKKKTIDFAELVKRILMGSPVKDWDRILVELPKEVIEGAAGGEETEPVLGPDGQPIVPAVATVGAEGDQEIPIEEVTAPPAGKEIRDPEIAEAISGAFSGNQVPPTQA